MLASESLFSDAVARASTIVTATSLNPFVIAERSRKKTVLVVSSSSKSAEDLAHELRELHPRVYEFPAWETLPHEKLSPRSDTVARRIATLHAIGEETEPYILITPIRGLIHRFNARLGKSELLSLSVGNEIPLTTLVEKLTMLAYTRTDLVERHGEFAVRGGIIDIFLPLADRPIRIDFFGDEIEEMKYFDVADQRSTSPVIGSVEIQPCRELLISDEVRRKALELEVKYPSAREVLGKISEGIFAEGMEALIPLLVKESETLLDRIPSNAELFIIDSPRAISRIADLIATNNEFLEAAWSNASDGAKVPMPSLDNTYLSWDEINDLALKADIAVRKLDAFGSDLDESATFIEAQEIEPLRGSLDALISRIQLGLRENKAVIFAASGHGMVERYAGILRESDIPVRIIENLNAAPTKESVHITTSKIAQGFDYPDGELLFITERDLSGSKSSGRESGRMPTRRKNNIDPLELKSGDYVVHEHHGVGRYVELVQRTVGGVVREYLVIEYAPAKRGQPSDRIFVPTDSLELVSKYIGGETPSIHRIGSGEWQKAKGRARKAVRQIAGELIRLYAARTSSPGFAFSPDTPWQRELEDAFSYIETPDQLSTIDDVKADMEKPYPMDRIICGDVGYGKTEIAVRAAFKAVQDGKQVAVLVPTTLLVQQHTKTFAERYAGFPLRVAGISRFNTAKEAKETLTALEKGTIDVIVGTHRLLSSDVHFKDLGLVIVDEEQRFGVEQKESLKKLRTTVDVLAMSATPIPRTLEMAVTGIREMSTITTPPEERHPVLTYVGPRDDAQIKAAIHRELLRDGQVFYIHNRVESIDRAALHLHELVPEARIRIAHGQMSEGSLEEVIIAFWNREFDVLVCTTIVESGLDIANANTLIVERADAFGLSQLHQLRGRVGRGRERAYAYFLYPTDKPLTEIAIDRLKTIASNTDLGSGMRVALKDLEIRGAGNLLGGEQSGHIADVGFDLYMRMVGEAVTDYKAGFVEGVEKESDCKVELPINAHLSDEYVPGERLRLDLYRRLADVKSDGEISAISQELLDRFGPLPKEAEALLSVAQLRARAKHLGIREIVSAGKNIRISPLVLSEAREFALHRMYPGSLYKKASSTALLATPQVAAWVSDVSKADEMVDTSLLKWTSELLDILFPDSAKKVGK